MNSLIKIFCYLVSSLLLGALIAPCIYWGVSLIQADSWQHLGAFVHVVQQMPFHRYLSRSIQVVAFILLFPTISSLKIRSLAQLGLTHNTLALADFFIGIFAAIVPLVFLQTLLVLKGWYFLTGSFSFALLPKLMTTACVVALVEEFFFRGVVLGLMRHFLLNEAAVICSALIFAAVHFLNFPRTADVAVHWWSGFSLMLTIGDHLPAWPLMCLAFTTLLFVGCLLAWVTIRTRSLALAIGLHASWILGQQAFNHMATFAVEPSCEMLPWIGPSQIFGMVPVGLFMLLPFGMTLFFLLCWLKIPFRKLYKK